MSAVRLTDVFLLVSVTSHLLINQKLNKCLVLLTYSVSAFINRRISVFYGGVLEILWVLIFCIVHGSLVCMILEKKWHLNALYLCEKTQRDVT